jgi:hypothetical protein
VFDPTWDQTHDLLHSWQALGLTQPGIKPMIYYTHGKQTIKLVFAAFSLSTQLQGQGVRAIVCLSGAEVCWDTKVCYSSSKDYIILIIRLSDASTWFDPTRDQTHDLLHSWQALGLTQPGIKPMIYYTRGKHLV